MNKKEIVNKLTKIISGIRSFKNTKNLDINVFNFVSSGHLDSFELLKFHMLVEKKFKITLNAKDASSKKSSTIGGLASIIYKKIK